MLRRSVVVKGWVGAGALLLATGSAWGQQMFIYPQKGQSPQQQAQDTAECQAWATQQTGGPMAAAPMASAPPRRRARSRARRGAPRSARSAARSGATRARVAIGVRPAPWWGNPPARPDAAAAAAQAQNQQMQAAQADTSQAPWPRARRQRLFGELAMRTMTMKKLQAAGLGVTLTCRAWSLPRRRRASTMAQAHAVRGERGERVTANGKCEPSAPGGNNPAALLKWMRKGCCDRQRRERPEDEIKASTIVDGQLMPRASRTARRGAW
jgi:hypothetical protein